MVRKEGDERCVVSAGLIGQIMYFQNAGQRHDQTFDTKEKYCKNVDGFLLFKKHPNSGISLLTISGECEDDVWSLVNNTLDGYLIANLLIDLSNSVFTDLVGKILKILERCIFTFNS